MRSPIRQIPQLHNILVVITSPWRYDEFLCGPGQKSNFWLWHVQPHVERV